MVGLRRKLAEFRFTLLRGYTWCQTPTYALVGAGVLAPYIQQYFDISMWVIALIAFCIFYIVGVIDKKLKLLHAEQSYATENNPTMMRGLFREEKK